MAGPVLIDDGDSGFSAAGWSKAIGPNFAEYSGSDTAYLDKGLSPVPSLPPAVWNFLALPADEYRVQVTWTGHQNRSTDARYTVTDMAGNVLIAKTVSQRNTPTDQRVGNSWYHTLGTVSFSQPTTIIVQLSPFGNGALIADAARVESTSTPLPPGSQFRITLRYLDNTITPSQRLIFQRAADRWGEIIVGDVPDAVFNGWGPYPSAAVDDILIDASAPSIDGPGGILGSAGPDITRPGSVLPVHATMRFDAADVAALEANGGLYYVCLHEMCHCLGFGTIWQYKNLVSGTNFTGANAMAVYGGPVPLETNGGSGTAGSHWAESVFLNEIMTGYLNPGVNPISRLTIASLIDLGYVCDMSQADPSLVQAVSGERKRID